MLGRGLCRPRLCGRVISLLQAGSAAAEPDHTSPTGPSLAPGAQSVVESALPEPLAKLPPTQVKVPWPPPITLPVSHPYSQHLGGNLFLFEPLLTLLHTAHTSLAEPCASLKTQWRAAFLG